MLTILLISSEYSTPLGNHNHWLPLTCVIFVLARTSTAINRCFMNILLSCQLNNFFKYLFAAFCNAFFFFFSAMHPQSFYDFERQVAFHMFSWKWNCNFYGCLCVIMNIRVYDQIMSICFSIYQSGEGYVYAQGS